MVKGTPIAEVMDQYAKQNNITKSRMSYEQRQEGGVDDSDCPIPCGPFGLQRPEAFCALLWKRVSSRFLFVL